MSAISACLFDYGNTIVEFDRVQTDRILAELATFLSSRVGEVDFELLRDEMKFVCALPYRPGDSAFRELPPLTQMSILLERVLERELDPAESLVAEANDELQRLFVESISIESDVVDYLGELATRMPLGIVSNYPCGTAIRRSLEVCGILERFDPIVVSGDIGFVKPHALPFEAALEKLSCPAQEVLFVGDRWDADMLGANWQGMLTCHHLGYTSDLDLKERYEAYLPDHRIQHLRELENIL
jgi:putative hydrolase of the HAD superfamily